MKSCKKQCFTSVVLLTLLAGCSSTSNLSESSMQNASQAERLGTRWGDEVNSLVTSVDLRRTSEKPIEQMHLYYADKNYSGRAINSMSLVAGKIDFSVATDRGNLSLYRDNGHYYVQGHAGQAKHASNGGTRAAMQHRASESKALYLRALGSNAQH